MEPVSSSFPLSNTATMCQSVVGHGLMLGGYDSHFALTHAQRLRLVTYFMCMDVPPTLMFVYSEWAQCPQRSDEGVRVPLSF